MSDAPFLSRVLLAFGGLIVWAAHFTVAYIAVALICARPTDMRILGLPLGPASVIAASLVAALAILGLLLASRRVEAGHDGPPAIFLRATAVAVALLSLLAVAWNTLPVLLLPVCA